MMIITRAPLRLSLGGGGTDLPSYYQQYEGLLVAGALDKYIYITLHQQFQPGILLKYSEIERCSQIEDIKHPLIKKCLENVNLENAWPEIISIADIPAGTGLGSSSTFTVALLRALTQMAKVEYSKKDLAELACSIEIEQLENPIGKQDQYCAAFGGLNIYHFHKDGSVSVTPLHIEKSTLYSMEENLLLFYTGLTRSASNILKDQKERTQQADQSMIDNLHFTKEIGHESIRALEKGDLEEYAQLLNRHWEHKRKRSSSISNSSIDELYQIGRKNGALGGKLVGAGGGGLLMFYAVNKKNLRDAMKKINIIEVPFRFDYEGVKVMTT